jgi:hypothetical protein
MRQGLEFVSEYPSSAVEDTPHTWTHFLHAFFARAECFRPELLAIRGDDKLCGDILCGLALAVHVVCDDVRVLVVCYIEGVDLNSAVVQACSEAVGAQDICAEDSGGQTRENGRCGQGPRAYGWAHGGVCMQA